MKKNMGTLDRAVRIILATSLISFCPLYTMLGINTCGVKKNA